MAAAFTPIIIQNGAMTTLANKGIGFGSSTMRLFVNFDKKKKDQLDNLKRRKLEEEEERQRKKKRQRIQADGSLTTDDGEYLLSDEEEIQEEKDRKEFEELLNQEFASGGRRHEFDEEGRDLTDIEDSADKNAPAKFVLFEGDPVPVKSFQQLVSVKTGVVLGETGTERILPWWNKNVLMQEEYMKYIVIISDPRTKSAEFRTTMKRLAKDLPQDIVEHTIFINSDTLSENKRWIKKQLLDIELLSDVHKQWMKEYTALGKQSWSMSMFILANGRVQRLVRRLDVDSACTIVRNAVKSLDKYQY